MNFPKKNSAIFKETIEQFVNLGLILAAPAQSPCTYTYIGNKDALQAYVNALATVLLPVRKWVVEGN